VSGEAPAIERRDADTVAVRGPLSFATVPQVWREGRGLFSGGGRLVVDLSGVGRADSAGVALLVEWLRAARARGVELSFRGMPAQMRAIATATRLDTLLPVEEGEGGATTEGTEDTEGKGQ
jgi:phospholipid transport system transporter-binding protein